MIFHTESINETIIETSVGLGELWVTDTVQVTMVTRMEMFHSFMWNDSKTNLNTDRQEGDHSTVSTGQFTHSCFKLLLTLLILASNFYF